MGFKDLSLFIIALLGTKIWRLMNNKLTLFYRVLSTKYFPNGDLFNSKKLDKLSYAWTNLHATARIIAALEVGDGKSIYIRDHNWGFKGLG